MKRIFKFCHGLIGLFFVMGMVSCSGQNESTNLSISIDMQSLVQKNESKNNFARNVFEEDWTFEVTLVDVEKDEDVSTISVPMINKKASVTFEKIPLFFEGLIEAKVSQDETILYEGKSNVFVVLEGKNPVELKMIKVPKNPEQPDDDDTTQTEEPGDNPTEEPKDPTPEQPEDNPTEPENPGQNQPGEDSGETGDDDKTDGEDSGEIGDDDKTDGEDSGETGGDNNTGGEDSGESGDDDKTDGEDSGETGDDDKTEGEDSGEPGDDDKTDGEDSGETGGDDNTGGEDNPPQPEPGEEIKNTCKIVEVSIPTYSELKDFSLVVENSMLKVVVPEGYSIDNWLVGLESLGTLDRKTTGISASDLGITDGGIYTVTVVIKNNNRTDFYSVEAELIVNK